MVLITQNEIKQKQKKGNCLTYLNKAYNQQEEACLASLGAP